MMIGYMLTWTTYGSWLQGDRRGWVKNGKIYHPDSALENANLQQMKSEKVFLSEKQKTIANKAIIDEAITLDQEIFELIVCTNHVHIVAENIRLTIGRVVSHYKNAIRLALQEQDFNGKLWTRSFDKRYCLDLKELNARIEYVRNHKR